MSRPDARVTVVVRTADEPALLRRSLADVARQTLLAWHLVVVVRGHDADAVHALVDDLDPAVAERVTVVTLDPAAGPGAATNAALDASAREFVALHDHDTWDPRFLERTVAHLDAHPAHAAVVTAADVVDEEVHGTDVVVSEPAALHPDGVTLTVTDLLLENRFVPAQLVYRRSVHDDLGPFREGASEARGWEFHLRLASAFAIGRIEEVLACWHRRSDPSERDHDDLLARDDALGAHIAAHGPGDLLYLTRFLRDEFDRLHEANAALGERVEALRDELDRLHARLDGGTDHYNEWLGHLQRRLDDIETTTREVSVGAMVRRRIDKVDPRKR